MGSVADKMAKKIASYRRSKVVDLASLREAEKMWRDTGLGGEGLVPEKFADVEPCQGMYMYAQNVVSLLAEVMSTMKEAKGYAKIVGAALDDYQPSWPPLSPLSKSYFSMWASFDVRFGSSRETVGTCILRMASDFGLVDWLVEAIEKMQHSRMGFFVHCGHDDDGVLLREVGTQDVVSCDVSSGHAGRQGEVWFTRVLPPPHALCRRHVVFTSPYVIGGWPESAFVDYLVRESARMTAHGKLPRDDDDPHAHLMKYGPDPNYWNEYVFCAYSNFCDQAIYLTGIPDIRESLPHGRLAQ